MTYCCQSESSGSPMSGLETPGIHFCFRCIEWFGSDCGFAGRVVVLNLEGHGFYASFPLSQDNVPLGKALDSKLPSELCISV